jgi:hypothetical protein
VFDTESTYAVGNIGNNGGSWSAGSVAGAQLLQKAMSALEQFDTMFPVLEISTAISNGKQRKRGGHRLYMPREYGLIKTKVLNSTVALDETFYKGFAAGLKVYYRRPAIVYFEIILSCVLVVGETIPGCDLLSFQQASKVNNFCLLAYLF